MNFLTIGEMVYDINILLENYLNEGSEVTTKEIINCCGGSASVTSFALAKWNVDSYISGILGNDENATFMRKMINETRVKTNYLETDYEAKTPVSYIIQSKNNHSYSVITAAPNEMHIKKHEYDLAMNCVITDGTDTNASIYALNKYANSLTILNAKTPDRKLLEIFKYVKYAVISKEVAESMTGLKIDFNSPITMANIYKTIAGKYPHLTLIINIQNKGTIYNLNGEIKFLAALNEEIIDAIGSHDIYVAGIAYCLMNNLDIESSIRFASIAVSIANKTLGSTLSIPLLSDIITIYENKFGKLSLNNNAQDVGENPTSVPNQEGNNNASTPQ